MRHFRKSTPSEYLLYTPMNHCSKFGTLDRSVTIIQKNGLKLLDYSVAMKTISVLNNNFLDVGCFGHTLDLVGKNMKTPDLTSSLKAGYNPFHSPKTRLIWRMQTGLSMPSYSPTRWWSIFEVINHLFKAFGDVSTVL